MGEPLAPTEFFFQFCYGLHGSFVGGMELCFVGGLLYRQLLIIVPVQRIKGISVIGNHFHQIERIASILYSAARSRPC